MSVVFGISMGPTQLWLEINSTEVFLVYIKGAMLNVSTFCLQKFSYNIERKMSKGRLSKITDSF